MKLGLISLISPVHNQDVIDRTLQDYLGQLADNFELVELERDDFMNSVRELESGREYEVVLSEEIVDLDLILVFVKSGGTENLFLDLYKYLPQPVYLLSTPLHNS
ncbi:MAG: hypothetical protein UMV23_06800, partial [Halanaerobium sp.]|nr:hypothetical protein [Halanaerobium sp.]